MKPKAPTAKKTASKGNAAASQVRVRHSPQSPIPPDPVPQTLQESFDKLRDQHEDFRYRLSGMVEELVDGADYNSFWRDLLLETALHLTVEVNKLARLEPFLFQHVVSVKRQWPTIASPDSYRNKPGTRDRETKTLLQEIGLIQSSGKRVSYATPQTRYAWEMHSAISGAIEDLLRDTRFRDKGVRPPAGHVITALREADDQLCNHCPLSLQNYKAWAKCSIRLLPIFSYEFGGVRYETQPVWKQQWNYVRGEDGKRRKPTADEVRQRIKKAIQRAFRSLAIKRGV